MELTKALQERDQAEDKISEILRRDFPPGATVIWRMGETRQYGIVLANGYGDRIKVQNTYSRRAYWIYAYRIEEP